MAWMTRYDSNGQTLMTQVSGVMTLPEVTAWRESLYQLARDLPPSAEFRTLIDLFGYDVAEQDREAHTALRETTPIFLAVHGFAVGFWRLYELDAPVAEASARCRAVAHVHHECDKMDRYNELLATPVERFFCDREAATVWLSAA